MKVLTLTSGHKVFLNDRDFRNFSGWSWKVSQRGYVCRTKKQPRKIPPCTTVYLHKEIMGVGKGQIVDHRDRNPLNCRRSNLRLSDKRTNAYNSKKPNREILHSKFKGITWVKKAGLWWVKGAGRCFNDEIEAAKAYDALVLRERGEFATTNVSLGLL